MIRKTTFLLLILFITQAIYSQNDSITVYQLEYTKKITFDSITPPFIDNYTYTKFIEYNNSIFNIKPKSKKENEQNKENDNVIVYTPNAKNVSTVYKNYNKQTLYNKHEVAFKYVVVKDSLTVFNWTILDQQKTILGYSCQLASTTFRGRNYSAWFSPELPIGGPWKFDGLPGMILEISSKDNFIVFKATKLKNSKIIAKTIKNPFNIKKSISWLKFITLYKKKAIELMLYTPDQDGLGIETSRGGIEYYIKKDDKAYNEALKKAFGDFN